MVPLRLICAALWILLTYAARCVIIFEIVGLTSWVLRLWCELLVQTCKFSGVLGVARNEKQWDYSLCWRPALSHWGDCSVKGYKRVSVDPRLDKPTSNEAKTRNLTHIVNHHNIMKGSRMNRAVNSPLSNRESGFVGLSQREPVITLSTKDNCPSRRVPFKYSIRLWTTESAFTRIFFILRDVVF